jgi:hypothetical protein
MSSITSRLSYANIIASLALFIALGGVSWAAVSLPQASVGNRQLKANAVSSEKVRNGSLLAADFKPSQLPVGPRGLAGTRGIPGPQRRPWRKGRHRPDRRPRREARSQRSGRDERSRAHAPPRTRPISSAASVGRRDARLSAPDNEADAAQANAEWRSSSGGVAAREHMQPRITVAMHTRWTKIARLGREGVASHPCRQLRDCRRRQPPNAASDPSDRRALPRLRVSPVCLLPPRSAATCKRTWLPLAWPSSHACRRRPRCWSGRVATVRRTRRRTAPSVTEQPRRPPSPDCSSPT